MIARRLAALGALVLVGAGCGGGGGSPGGDAGTSGIDAGTRDGPVGPSACKKIDLLISVDTAAAHLAGALGRSAWILLPAIGSDWRWGITGETTAWYPSARLFRQRRAGDWAATVAEMAALLAAMR